MLASEQNILYQKLFFFSFIFLTENKMDCVNLILKKKVLAFVRVDRWKDVGNISKKIKVYKIQGTVPEFYLFIMSSAFSQSCLSCGILIT